jgi:general secretion pathway protein E
METIIEGRWKRRMDARLHVAPEGMTLVDDTGAVMGTVTYAEVQNVSADRDGRRSLLRIDAGPKGEWLLHRIHPLQARFAAELIQEQLSALHRRNLPLYAEPQPLGALPERAGELLASSPRGIVEALDFLLCQAAQHGASDIHIEPFPGEVRVRFRVDGSLTDVAHFPLLWLPRLFARLKVIARLMVYRSDVPQEGRLALHLADRVVDVRVTLLPTLHGEKAVLRLFDPSRTLISLDHLGMDPETLRQWKGLLQQPQGLLLLTGPSNHGKTTTMYAGLSFLHEHRRDLTNLCTVEDPIEYDLRVINQTQVNNAVGLSFAAGLRTVLRQDPEVIMIGEIRDEETAGIAVRAGLTGHLIKSTVHAPSAGGVFARLLDLGCEPFLVASAVTGVLSQRLIRTLCADCRRPEAPAEETLGRLGLSAGDGAWAKGTGCPACGGTGYRGRTGVFELLEVTPPVREAILAGKPVPAVEAAAGRRSSMRDRALARAAAGETTLAEVERVLGVC